MVQQLSYEELEERNKELEKEVTKRKRAEESLRKKEERFRLLYERAPLSYQSLDENGNFIEVNHAWLDTLGYTREEVIGRSFGDFLHPEWIDHFKENFPRFKAVGEILGVEFEMVKKDGSLIMVNFNGKIGKDAKGAFKQTHCILYDITSKKKAEKALRESEAKTKAILKALPDQIFRLSKDAEHMDFYAPSIDKLYLDPEEFLGKHVNEVLPREVGEKYQYYIRKALETCQTQVFEYQLDFPEGPRHYESRMVVSGENETLTIVRNITERRQAEEARKESEDRLKSFYDAAFEGIALTRQGKIIDVNKRICKLFGYERDELIGGEVMDLVAEEDRELVIKNIKSNSKKSYEHRAVHKDGSIIFLEVKGQQIQFKGQSSRVTTIHDISERKHSEAALRESKEKYRLLVEDINDVIYRTDQNGIITYVSPVVKSFAGYDPSELIGQPFIKIVYEKDIKLLTDKFQDLISGVIRPLMYRVVNKANEPIWVRSSSKLIYDGKIVVGVRGVITNISEEKRLQFQLEQALKMEAIGTLGLAQK